MAAPAGHVKQLRANLTRILILCAFLILLYLNSFINTNVHIQCDDLVRIHVGDQRQGRISRTITGTVLSFVMEEETSLLSVFDEKSVSTDYYEWFPDNATIFLHPVLKRGLYSFRIHYPAINMMEEYYLSGPWRRREENPRSLYDWIFILVGFLILIGIVTLFVIFISYILIVFGVACLTKYE
jgi:hypothetical protein